MPEMPAFIAINQAHSTSSKLTENAWNESNGSNASSKHNSMGMNAMNESKNARQKVLTKSVDDLVGTRFHFVSQKGYRQKYGKANRQ